jgi:hypothetical protein
MVRSAVRLALFSACLLLAACDKKPGDVTRATLRLRVAADPACQPSETNPYRVSALGDFPTTDRTVGILDPARGTLVFDTFPVDTRAVRVESDEMFGGTRFGFGAADNDLLLLPLSRTCRVSDEALPGLLGAAIARLPNGGMLAIGGAIDDIAQRSVLRLGAGAAHPELLEVNDALFTKRSFASATVTDNFVVVIGGNARSGDAPEDSIEVYNLETERFDRDSLPTMFLREGRSRHGAIALGQGLVLVAGGQGENGLLASSEIVDIENGNVEVDVGSLPSPRRNVSLIALDDGTVLAVGGEVALSTTSYRPVGDVLVFDVQARTYAPLVDGLAFEARVGAAALALPGNRVAHIGGSLASEFVDAVDILHTHGEPHIERAALINPACATGAFCRALRDVRATTLLDGRALVAGVDAQNGSSHLYMLDFNRNTSAEISSTSAVTDVVTLADGTAVVLTREGLFLRRDTLASRYDNPSTLIAGSMDGILLDTPTHWNVAGNSVTALADARIDVPLLRYADVDIELAVEGDADLLLVGEADSDVVSVREDEVGFALCHAARVSGENVVVSRRGDTFAFNGGSGTMSCASSGGLGLYISIAITARAGTALRALRLVRIAY